MKFQRQYDKSYKGARAEGTGEINTGKSMTVPDQAIPIKKLLENHTRGIPSNVTHYEPLYFEGEVPDMAQDISEIKERGEELLKKAYELEKLRSKAQSEKKAKQTKADTIAAHEQQKSDAEKLASKKQPGMEDDGKKPLIHT